MGAWHWAPIPVMARIQRLTSRFRARLRPNATQACCRGLVKHTQSSRPRLDIALHLPVPSQRSARLLKAISGRGCGRFLFLCLSPGRFSCLHLALEPRGLGFQPPGDGRGDLSAFKGFPPTLLGDHALRGPLSLKGGLRFQNSRKICRHRRLPWGVVGSPIGPEQSMAPSRSPLPKARARALAFHSLLQALRRLLGPQTCRGELLSKAEFRASVVNPWPLP